ncbi:zinc finger, CCHC-type containing protein [Tanacetum coccineum]
MEESLSKFMVESAKRHDENSNLIKEIQASTDAAIKNQGASIKALEIQIRQMSKVLGELMDRKEYATNLKRLLMEKPKMGYQIEASMNVHDSSILDDSLSPKEKRPSLGELAPTNLIIELDDRTIKCPNGITENVLVDIDKFVFPIDFIVLDMPEDIKVPLILGRPFLSTVHAKIDVFKRKITLRVGDDKIVFKSDNPTSSIIRRVYALGLRKRMELDLEVRLMGEALILNRSLDHVYGYYNELNGYGDDVNIITLTISNTWLGFNDDIRPGVVKPRLAINNHKGNKIDDSPDSIDAIQESFKEAHPSKECPLKKEDKEVEQREKFKARTTMGKENMKEPVPRDLPPTPFLGHLKEQIGSPYRTRETVCMIENPGEVHKMKAREDEGDIDVGWDIKVKDAERLREEEQDYDIPLHDGVMQPLAPQTVHITPPDDDYVAPTTNPILDKQLKEFRKEFSDITRVAKKANCNPVNDVKEFSDIKKYDCETFIWKLLHQVSQSSHETGKMKARHVTQQDYGITTRKVYAATLLLWKDESSESALRRNVDT